MRDGEAFVQEVVIENPVINSAFLEPRKHFKFDDDGITDEIVEQRRPSAYFIPVAQPKKKGAQLQLGTEATADRLHPNDYINEVRGDVAGWRARDYPGVTRTTRQLLKYWKRPGRDRRLFFCQLEAVETAIYLTECADKMGRTYLNNRLAEENNAANPGLNRLAFKMATGSGKTVVMAMLIAWHALNKIENPQDGRFSDSFLIVTPGITIRDRLRVLLPNDAGNYYRALDVVPAELMERLNRAQVVITNFHAFLLHEKMPAGKLTKRLLAGRSGSESPFTETPDEMVRRVCREFGTKKNIVVINDEAHHCYRGKPAEAEGETDEAALKGEDKKEAQQREKEARVWISGLEAVKKKIGVRAIYDLSATPFFLRGSGYAEGTLFPWVVSDFSLVDAIECGIVKVPRVPVADDSMADEIPKYRHIWPHVKDALPKKGRKQDDATGGAPELPKELEGALRSLYGNYELYHQEWMAANEENETGTSLTPPVFIVVCNNTNVSKLVYDWIAGWEQTKTVGDLDITSIVPGQLERFSNVERFTAGQNRWTERPNTILVDSSQIESGEAMSPEFKKVAAREIEEFKSEYRQRFPERDVDAITDEDLLREVMNTVGKAGRLGEQVKCVVSVSMLTEGWDANTVTHVLGIRAFSTQLLCEQVVGRALRRTTYVTNAEDDLFPAEYAEVYGVPFSFIPVGPVIAKPVLPKKATRVRALPERVAHELTFPRLTGYRYEVSGEKLVVEFDEMAQMSLSTADVPTMTENAPIIGESVVHTLDDLEAKRLQEVDFLLAKLVYETYFRVDDGAGGPADKPWLFPQILQAARAWRQQCLTCKNDCFPQLLLLVEYAHAAAEKIYRAIVSSTPGVQRLLPILRPYDTVGSTSYLDFDTTRPVWKTDPDKCHISHVVCDTDSWEQKMAQQLEEMDEVESYAKNHNLGFTIPYTYEGEAHQYIPDFLVRLKIADGGEPLTLIIEVSGEPRPEKAAKVETARALWVPAVNNHGGFGRWGFLEISDPWDCQETIRAWQGSATSAASPSITTGA
jgi:type III restriction enzyme